MTPDNQEMKYRNLFRKNEEETDIPEFDEILNLPIRQKKHSGKLAKVSSALVLCLTLVIGIYYYPTNKVSKNETILFQDKKSLVWEWKSPTEQLLSPPMSNTLTGFSLPTDCLSPQKTTLQINNYKKNKLKK
jgi:hypothetical protein